MKTTKEDWKRACEKVGHALDVVPDGAPESYMAELAEDAAFALLGLARMMTGHGCKDCGGTGQRLYPSTATWRGGIGGMMMTTDVCDRCWGSGRTDRKGPDLRKIISRVMADATAKLTRS